MARYLVAPLLLALLVGRAPADVHKFQVVVEAGKRDYMHVPILVPISVPARVGLVWHAKLEAKGMALIGQVSPTGIITKHRNALGQAGVHRELHFILPQLKAGASLTLNATMDTEQRHPPDGLDGGGFFTKGQEHEDYFIERKGKSVRLLRYRQAPFDDSTKEKREQTYKVFHHLFDPSGKQFVTNGGFADESIGDPKKLLYPHHRGLMFGFNRISYGPDFKKKADTWHCSGDAHQSHQDDGDSQSGPVQVRKCVFVNWHGEKKEVFAREERELSVFNLPGGTLVEFASRLKPTAGPVKLDGDPQHAGFQFRAHNDVATKTAKETYYLRPDGKDELGKTRNWPEVKSHANLPWNAMSFVLDGKRYTVCYVNHPNNPGEQRYSERDYGRFGCYFEYDLTEERPLVVNYRIWLQEGEMTGEQVQALWNNFAQPPKVTVR